jgi:hypothetical protein
MLASMAWNPAKYNTLSSHGMVAETLKVTPCEIIAAISPTLLYTPQLIPV